MTFLILSAVVLSALSASRNPDSPDLIAITLNALGTPSASTVLSALRALTLFGSTILSTLRALALVDTLSTLRDLALFDTLSAGRSPLHDLHDVPPRLLPVVRVVEREADHEEVHGLAHETAGEEGVIRPQAEYPDRLHRHRIRTRVMRVAPQMGAPTGKHG